MPPSLEADAQIPPNPTAIIIDAARNLLLLSAPLWSHPKLTVSLKLELTAIAARRAFWLRIRGSAAAPL